MELVGYKNCKKIQILRLDNMLKHAANATFSAKNLYCIKSDVILNHLIFHSLMLNFNTFRHKECPDSTGVFKRIDTFQQLTTTSSRAGNLASAGYCFYLIFRVLFIFFYFFLFVFFFFCHSF